MKIKGISAARGLAMGPAYIFLKEKLEIDQTPITEDQKAGEEARFLEAVAGAKLEIEARKAETPEEIAVKGAHLEIAEDPYIVESVQNKIGELKNADLALNETIEEMASMMEMLDDPYLKERALDIRDIGEQIAYRLLGKKRPDLSQIDVPSIVLAEDITPSETSTMDRTKVLGMITNLGGKTSHTAIIAQTWGIPAICGVKENILETPEGTMILMDAESGDIVIDPDQATASAFADRLEAQKAEQEQLDQLKMEVAITSDGRQPEIACNIGGLSDLELGLEEGAEGVGLFRTEFLYMDNDHFPTEDEQFEVYKAAAERLEGKPLMIRTLDIGGDKSLPYFQFPVEENPFLGWRALRFCFDRDDVFDVQLRAILRASAFGRVRILLPMIVMVEEFERVKEKLAVLMAQLDDEGLAYDKDVEVGCMVETPASVIMAGDLAKYVDFFSIGTNDLTQYVLAVDRGNDKIAHLYNTYNPAVLRAIKKVIDASHKEGKWTGMCGGFAGDTDATYLLLGMGLDEFSAPPKSIPKIKDTIRNSSYAEAQAFADKVLACERVDEVMAYIK